MSNFNGLSVTIEDFAGVIEYLSHSQLTEDDVKSARKLAKQATKRLAAVETLIQEGIYTVAPEPVSGPQHPALFEDGE